MKAMILLCVLTAAATFCFAQEVKKDSNTCECNSKIAVKYPETEDQLEGTVIVEYEIDSLCFAGSPKIVQSLAPIYDKEALRVINLMITAHNKCKYRCNFSVCEKRKIKFPLTFLKPDEE